MRAATKRPEQKPGVMAGKVPQIMQMEALECGAACLAMVSAYWGKWVPLEQARADCGVSRDGSKAKNILVAARSYGFVAKGYRYEPRSLAERGLFPCICHWNFSHFIVVRGMRAGKVYVNDPARGELVMGAEEFDRGFTGVVLQLTPGEGFEPGGEPPSVAAFAAERLRGARTALVFVALTTAVTSILGVVNPVFSQVFTDRLLTGENPGWLTPFLVLLACVSAAQVIVAVLNAIYLERLEGKMAVSSSAGFFWRVLHLPMGFFSQRSTGDLIARSGTNATIASSLVSTLAPLAVNAVMLVVYLYIMLRYSPLLSLIGIVSVLANVAVARAVSKRRVNLTRVQMRDGAQLQSATMAGISMVETLKASGAEQGFFQRWAGFQAGANTQQVRSAQLSQALGLVPQLVSQASSVAVLALGVYLILQGELTVGGLLAFQSLLTQFSEPAESLTMSMQTFQEMRTDMERIQDVMDYPEDPLAAPRGTAVAARHPEAAPEAAPPRHSEPSAEGAKAKNLFAGKGEILRCAQDDESAAQDDSTFAQDDGSAAQLDEPLEKLRGELSMEHVTFGYAPLGDPVIEDFSMHVEPGGSVALVGASGCGKSTIAKLLSGLYAPWSGTVSFGGRPIEQIPRDVRTGSVAVIDQDITLFNCSIADNIRMWDASIEDFEVVLAARDAGVHDMVMGREGGYSQVLAEGGADLSGGQRQRLEIARALALDPTILILDEATSALDAKTEEFVMNNIKKRGCTMVVVAHRLSAVRDCDEIIVLERGHVVERGTHDELMAKGGAYARLVTSE